jgi:hypothetical protein
MTSHRRDAEQSKSGKSRRETGNLESRGWDGTADRTGTLTSTSLIIRGNAITEAHWINWGPRWVPVIEIGWEFIIGRSWSNEWLKLNIFNVDGEIMHKGHCEMNPVTIECIPNPFNLMVVGERKLVEPSWENSEQPITQHEVETFVKSAGDMNDRIGFHSATS